MFVIIGYIVVFICVFGGYAIAGGAFGPIIKAAPIESFIIGGSAFGAFLTANNSKTIKATFKSIPFLLSGSKYTKARYMSLLGLLYNVLQKARKEGLMSIEGDVEAPNDSPLFADYPELLKDHHLIEFITDYLRMMVSGNLNAHEIENLMDSEIETHHAELHAPQAAIQGVGDGLPAFGIVAAVLGVIKTMASVDQPPAILGMLIAGALVGTFLGILMAYGFVSPVASLFSQKIEEGAKEFECVKITLLASMQGYAPQIAIEFGRKVLFSTERPSFTELEEHVKQKKA